MTERTIRLKCRYAEETRVVQISEATNYIDLRNRLNADFGFETSLKYEVRMYSMLARIKFLVLIPSLTISPSALLPIISSRFTG